MPVMPAPVGDRPQRAGEATRHLPHHVDALLRLSPDVGEAEEIKRGAVCGRVRGPLWPFEAEVDEARLVGMEGESIPGQTLAQHRQDPFGIEEVLEGHHQVVGVPDKDGSPLQARPDVPFEPFVQHIVQVDVRKARRNHAPLGRPFRWAVQTSLLEDAGFQPFVDHPSDNAVRDSSVEEFPEMAVVNRVEIFINIDTPSYSLTHEGCSESIQRLMGRAAWSEAIRAGEEILFVYCLQYHGHGTLCHFVFECRDTQRPLRAIRFRNIGPAHRWGVVTARLDAPQEVREIGLQGRLVVGRSHPIDARSTVLAGQPIGLPHPVQIDDVVQRAESYPRFRPRQFGYPLPVRGQVCRAQGPLPCFASPVLYSWRFPSLGRVPLSAVPRRCRYSGGATTSRPRIPGRLLVSLPGPTPSFLASCLAAALLSRRKGGPGPGSVVPPATHFRLLRTWT